MSVFNHSPKLSLLQDSVFGVLKTLAYLISSHTLAEKFLPKDRRLIFSPNVPNTMLPSRHSGAQGKRIGFGRKANGPGNSATY